MIAKLTVRMGGSPDDEDLIFTDLKPPALAESLTKMGTPVSPCPVADWLRGAGVRLRKIAKTIAEGSSGDRSAQIDRIGELIEQYENAGAPWFSIDTKSKEHLGRLYLKGRSYFSQPFEAFDHDFPSEVGRIKERSDAAPATARRMHIDKLPELRFAWCFVRGHG